MSGFDYDQLRWAVATSRDPDEDDDDDFYRAVAFLADFTEAMLDQCDLMDS